MSPAATDRHAAQTILAEATGLARVGRYDDARRALADLGEEDVAALDLLARMHAQQGDLAAADDCWARVQALDADHAGAREGRDRIRRIWAGSRKGVAGGIGIAAAALLLAGAGAVAGQALAPAQEEPAGDQDVAGELDRLAEALDEMQSPEPAPAPTVDPEADLSETETALQDPRWTAEASDQGVEVTFDEAIFPDGGTAVPESTRDLLADVAARLADLDGAAVTVVGHTNDIPTGDGSRYEDNTELGLARALAAAEALAAEGPLPLDEIAIATSGDDAPPYPNTTDADRRRNQTVTLLVTPA
jgi:flagellar motor protein MotB